MAREHTQNPRQKGRNPGTLPPEDDEIGEAGRSSIDDQPEVQEQQGAQRRSQDDRRRRPEENIEQVEDEEAEGDEDESDAISQRP